MTVEARRELIERPFPQVHIYGGRSWSGLHIPYAIATRGRRIRCRMTEDERDECAPYAALASAREQHA